MNKAQRNIILFIKRLNRKEKKITPLERGTPSLHTHLFLLLLFIKERDTSGTCTPE